MDTEKVKSCVKQILQEIGEDTEREGISATPERVARMYKNLFYGYRTQLVVMDEKKRNGHLEEGIIPITVFKNDVSKGLVVRKVRFTSSCEHHMVSFMGEAHIGVIFKSLMMGMNKIDKVVKHFSARLQVQERLTSQIADWLHQNIKPEGVIVVIKANHLCSELQGDDGHYITSEVRGVFMTDHATRQEFFDLIKRTS